MAAGCGDGSVTEPNATISSNAPGAAASRSPEVPASLSVYSCYLMWRDRSGVYQSRTAQVHFPKAELAGSGARRGYIYKGDAGDLVVYAAACGIPATDGALRRMNRTFRVPHETGNTGGIVTMGCVTSDAGCMLDGVTVNACPGGGTYPDCNQQVDVDDYVCFECGGSGGSGASGGGSAGGGSPIPPPPTVEEGPILFGVCVGSLLTLMGTTAAMQPLATGLYEARGEYDAAKRMYAAVMANNPTLEMQLLYETRVEFAKSNYSNAITGYAVAGGASIGLVIGAVVACSPGMLLPTL